MESNVLTVTLSHGNFTTPKPKQSWHGIWRWVSGQRRWKPWKNRMCINAPSADSIFTARHGEALFCIVHDAGQGLSGEVTMSDLIDRRKALDGLEYEMKYGAVIDRCGLDTAYDIIENLPSAEPERKWTPVTEALPEEDEEVLVTVRFDGTKDVKPSVYVETASQISGKWVSYSDEWKVSQNRHHVIAWMPLPEPWER